MDTGSSSHSCPLLPHPSSCQSCCLEPRQPREARSRAARPGTGGRPPGSGVLKVCGRGHAPRRLAPGPLPSPFSTCVCACALQRRGRPPRVPVVGDQRRALGLVSVGGRMPRCCRPVLSLTGCTEPRAGTRPASRRVSAGGRHPLRCALESAGGGSWGSVDPGPCRQPHVLCSPPRAWALGS